ncbi:hypothetical protein [Bradyrhizobium sp. HKCCYLS2033]|uniref:hypothetical protein n=1 Tax=Bradyrhizobium TaxID=374 RepID=UPI003EBAABFB
MKRSARATQADIYRAIRAAKKAGAGVVLVLPDGTIRIELEDNASATEPEKKSLAAGWEDF